MILVFSNQSYIPLFLSQRFPVRLRPDFSSAYRVLVAAAGMTGRKELATAALQQLRRIHPNISRAWIKSHVPLKLDTDLVHYLDGFRRAGLA